MWCIYVCVYMCVCVRVHVCIHICVCVGVSRCMHACMYVPIYACALVCVSKSMCVFVCMCVCTCVSVCTICCIYMCASCRSSVGITWKRHIRHTLLGCHSNKSNKRDYRVAGKFSDLTVFEHLAKKVWQINRLANRLLIINTNLDSFSLANHG